MCGAGGAGGAGGGIKRKENILLNRRIALCLFE